MQDGILDWKHQTNLNILAMMDVSKSWRVGIAKFDDLFRHIALNTSDGQTIVTASRILQMTETRSTGLEVFIKGAFRDLVGNAKLQVMAKELLRRLRLQSGRFISFEIRSPTSHIGSYFNLPAPKLHFLRCYHTMSPAIFSSSFPNLRTLHVYVDKVLRIPPAALSNLAELRLENLCRTQWFSVESVLTLLRDTNRLEVLQLAGFTRFGYASTVVGPVELTNLKSAQFMNCDLPELLSRLRLPQLCEFNFRGFNSTPDENTPPSMAGNTDFFSSLRACPLPILDQQVLTHVFVSMDNKGDKIEFTMRLMSGLLGPKYQFVITMVWEKWESWEERLERSIRGAMERVRFSPGVCLYIFHHIDYNWVPYSPLLHLPLISTLCTAGYFTPVALKLLINSSPTSHLPLPRLKCFCFKGDDPQVPAEGIQSLINHCLQSRFDKGQPLAIRRWVPSGNKT